MPPLSLFALPAATNVKQSLRRACAIALLIGAVTSTTLTAASRAIASPQPNSPQPASPQTNIDNVQAFDRAMRVGYAASRQGDFNTALINFRRALAIRPNQPYAQAAADNMAYYLQYERIAVHQRAIAQLEARLARATSQKDWVCAATTLDALTRYTEPDSLNRERLIGQRGEVSGLLDARIDHERWSTVCAAQSPVY
jgi:tetratricopeptide (TPR) repeat protein